MAPKCAVLTQNSLDLTQNSWIARLCYWVTCSVCSGHLSNLEVFVLKTRNFSPLIGHGVEFFIFILFFQISLPWKLIDSTRAPGGIIPWPVGNAVPRIPLEICPQGHAAGSNPTCSIQMPSAKLPKTGAGHSFFAQIVVLLQDTRVFTCPPLWDVLVSV